MRARRPRSQGGCFFCDGSRAEKSLLLGKAEGIFEKACARGPKNPANAWKNPIRTLAEQGISEGNSACY
jgi:hypothetical protein